MHFANRMNEGDSRVLGCFRPYKLNQQVYRFEPMLGWFKQLSSMDIFEVDQQLGLIVLLNHGLKQPSTF